MRKSGEFAYKLPVLTVLWICIFFAGCSSDEAADSSSPLADSSSADYAVSEEDYNKLVVMKYMEALSTSLRADVEAELLAPGYDVLRKEFANMDYHAAGSQLAKMADPMSMAIANRRDSVDVYVAEEDVVVVRYNISGTHSGNLYGVPATGAAVDIIAAAMFWLDDGKITRSWWMADEAGFLRQVGQQLPARDDGRWEAWPHVLPARTGNEIMEEALANPADTQEYRNKLQLTAWKARLLSSAEDSLTFMCWWKSRNKLTTAASPDSLSGERYRRANTFLLDRKPRSKRKTSECHLKQNAFD